MATTIGLGVQFTANANGMTKGLSDADRAIRNLAQQASSAAKLFDTFASSSAAAAQTQQQVATDVAFLGSAFRTGQISAEQYVAELRGIVSSANGAAQAFAEGAQVTERVATAEEKRAATLARLAQLLEQGAISQQTYERAAADASGANESAAKAESARAQALARAAQITQANLTPSQKYDQEVQELNQHLQAGRITQDTYNAALAKAAQSFAKAEVAAAKYDAAADAAGKGNNLAFNELSGILAGLPGPIGNVAGRLSGLASAGEGLGRVFGGGLSQGFDSLASSAAGLINPMTAGLAAVAAFGAGAAALLQGLRALDDRVEQLGNTADKLGISFGFVQVLDEAARRSGTSIEAVSAAFGRLQKSVLGVDEESKAAAAALTTIGVAAQELQALSPEQQYKLIGERLAEIEDPAKRSATATQLFGNSGAELIPFFNNLEGAADDIERVGKALSSLQRQDIDQFGASMDRLSVASRSASEQLLSRFAPAAGRTADAAANVAGAVARNSDIVANAVATTVNNMTGGTLFVVDLAARAINAFSGAAEKASEAAESAAGLRRDIAGLDTEPPEGFVDFEKSIAKTREALNDVIAESAQFGQAGFDAALQFQTALQNLQAQAEAGILNETAYQQEVQKATAAYRSQIDTIKEAAAEEERKAEAARRSAEAAIEADRKRVDAALERQRIENEFGGDSRRAEAARNVLALENEAQKVLEEYQKARNAGDRDAANAAAARIAQLDQAAAKERDIASGVRKAIDDVFSSFEDELSFDNFVIAPDVFRDAQSQLDELKSQLEQGLIDPNQFRVAAEDVRRGFEDAFAKAQEINKLNQKYAERAADIEADRLDALSRASQEALKVGDLRTSEGASQFLASVTGREDPAVEEYRKQLRELQDIKREIARANAAPVEIAG